MRKIILLSELNFESQDIQSHTRETAPRPTELKLLNQGSRMSIRKGVVRLKSGEKPTLKENCSGFATPSNNQRHKSTNNLLRLGGFGPTLGRDAGGRGQLTPAFPLASLLTMQSALTLTCCHLTLNFSLFLFHTGQISI